jgi:ATP-dependent protease HslVU (ClpYQ) peptidase subunit
MLKLCSREGDNRMTCIVAIKDKHGVVMGADSRCTTGNEQHVLAAPKIFRCGKALIGMAGSLRSAVTLQHRLVLPDRKRGMGIDEYACAVVPDAVRNCFIAAGLPEATHGDDDTSHLALLMAYEGRIFLGDSLGFFVEYQRDFSAIGSAEDYASGYLYATRNSKMSTESRVEKALEAAAHFDPGVGGPFVIVRASLDPKRSVSRDPVPRLDGWTPSGTQSG